MGRLQTAVRATAALSTVALLAVVAGVGLVAVVAETQQSWGWYFRMEQAMTVGASAAVILASLAVASLLALVAVVGTER